ncbi:MAG: hypothetical protein QW474_02815, partial [Candidatus Aenigmatarchaeota archaeon]
FRRIDIALDNYDDIFSDFDNSPYSSRLISDDFVHEVIRKYDKRERKKVQIYFSIPAKLRNPKIESIIKKRIKEYFLERLLDIEERIRNQKKEATLLMSAGFSSLLLVLLVTFPSLALDNFVVRTIETFLLPVGWFGLWEGANRFFESAKRFNEERNTFKALSEADYIFVAEEKIIKSLTLLSESLKSSNIESADTKAN